MKRFWQILFMLVLIGLGMITWILIKKAPDLIRQSARDTPYDVTVARISGTPWSGVVLQDVRVRFRQPSEEFARVKEVRIGLRWRALLGKEVRITQLVFVEPVIRIVRRPDGTIGSSQAGVTRPASTSAWLIMAQDIDVRDGRIEWADQSRQPAGQLVLAGWNMRGQYAQDRVTLNPIQLRIGEGVLSGSVSAVLKPVLSVEANLETWQVPLEKILAAVQPSSPGLRLPESGRWKLKVSSSSWEIDHRGRVADGTVQLQAAASLDRPMAITGNGAVEMKGAQVQFQVVDGRGPIQVRYRQDDFNAEIDGQADLVAPSVKATYTVRKSSLQVSGAVAWRPSRGVDMDGRVDGLLQNRGMVTFSGLIPPTRGESTRFVWNDLRLRTVSGDVWNVRRDGFMEYRENRVVLSNVKVDRSDVSGSTTPWMSIDGSIPLRNEDTLSLHVETLQIDPATLNPLLPNVTIASGGELQIRAHMTGRITQPSVQGVIRVRIPKLELNELGMTLRDVELHASADGQAIAISTFTAKTKKGSLRLSGHSTLPDLNYVFRADRLAVTLESGTQADTDADIRIAGTLKAPQVQGSILIRNATYRPPRKKAAVAASRAPVPTASGEPSLWTRTAVDIGTQWSRNVWYRDGLSGIETSADLHIRKTNGTSSLELVGDIALLRGGYHFYGKDFTIESGQIRFPPGAREMNPLLKVEASYHREPTIIYLSITGTANVPVLSMRSSPPLSEQDILSVLVFGVPVRSLNNTSGSGTRQEAAMRAAGSLLGGYFSRGLRETGIDYLSLDVFDIQPRSEGSELTLGRYVTPNLFVSYGQTLNATGSRALGAEYYLSRRWTIKGEAGSVERNYMDLLFRYPVNRGSETAGQTLRASPFVNTLQAPLDRP